MFKNFVNHEEELVLVIILMLVSLGIIIHAIYEVKYKNCKISELGFVWLILPFVLFMIWMGFESVNPKRIQEERKVLARIHKDTRYYITIGDDWTGYYCSSYQENGNSIEFMEHATGRTIKATKPYRIEER